MARLRQLPQVYLRGAIANETMKHLPLKDQIHINQLTETMAHSPLLAGHRQEFIMKLSHTIGCDYHDDRASAEQEFTIAVWRALIYLLHHTNYSYQCDACGQGSYMTQRSRPQHFDRRYPICRNCQCVRITDPGDTDLKIGQFIKHDDLQTLILEVPGNAPRHASPLRVIRGDRKVADHHAVLSDPEQTSKFFGEFIWNYFRQALRENEIKYHSKNPHTVSGPADKMAVEEVLSSLARVKYPHTYTAAANPYDGFYRVLVDLDIADVVLVKRILALTCKYSKYGVCIEAGDSEIIIREHKGAAPVVEAFVVKPQVVAMQTKSARIEDGSEDFSSIYDAFHSNIVGGQAMQEDGIAKLESDDLLATIRSALPDGAQQVLDILSQTGETWQRFSLPPSTGAPRGVRASELSTEPKEAHIARFLNVSPKQIKQWMSDIRVQCLVHNMADQ